MDLFNHRGSVHGDSPRLSVLGGPASTCQGAWSACTIQIGKEQLTQNPEDMAGDAAQLLTSHCLHSMQGWCLESSWTKLWSSLGFRPNPLGLPSLSALDLTFQVPFWMLGSLGKEECVCRAVGTCSSPAAAPVTTHLLLALHGHSH